MFSLSGKMDFQIPFWQPCYTFMYIELQVNVKYPNQEKLNWLHRNEP